MEMSAACTPPTQPAPSIDERQHPRYPEYANYRAAVASQLATATTFALWLEQTERAENGFRTTFEVTSRTAVLAPGWYCHIFGPNHVLKARHGPFATSAEADSA